MCANDKIIMCSVCAFSPIYCKFRNTHVRSFSSANLAESTALAPPFWRRHYFSIFGRITKSIEIGSDVDVDVRWNVFGIVLTCGRKIYFHLCQLMDAIPYWCCPSTLHVNNSIVCSEFSVDLAPIEKCIHRIVRISQSQTFPNTILHEKWVRLSERWLAHRTFKINVITSETVELRCCWREKFLVFELVNIFLQKKKCMKNKLICYKTFIFQLFNQ